MLYLLLPQDDLYPVIELVTPIDNLFWATGERFRLNVERLDFEFDPEGLMTWADYIRPAPNIPLVSDKLRETWSAVGVDNIDYYTARVMNRSTGETRPYHAANVIGLLPAVDRAQSAFQPLDDHDFLIEDFERLVVDEKRVQGQLAFRLAEHSAVLLVDQRLKDISEREGLTGLQFVRPEDWDGFAT